MARKRQEPPEQGRLGLKGAPPERGRPIRRLRRAADRTLVELRRTDRLDKVDVGLVAAYRDAAALAEDEMVARERSTFSAERALRLFVDVHVRLAGGEAPIVGELEQFLAGLSGPQGRDTAQP